MHVLHDVILSELLYLTPSVIIPENWSVIVVDVPMLPRFSKARIEIYLLIV